jgi:hypothetical protein
MDPHLATSAYGYAAYTPAYPGGASVLPVTDIGINTPAGILPKLGMGPSNPLFWVLVIFLIISGYLSIGFDIGFKKLGKLNVGT